MPAADEPLLAGLTVLDFTRVLAGPYCTRLLCDLGARVIKVERPGEGDDTRRGHAQIEPGRGAGSVCCSRYMMPDIALTMWWKAGCRRSGPLWPKPEIEQYTRSGFTADSAA